MSATVVLAAGFDLSWYTIDDGGGTSPGGTFELSGTMGQAEADVQTLAGGGYQLKGGFWPGMPCGLDLPADLDGDCDVDAADYVLFDACFSGPTNPYNPASLPQPPPGCVLTPNGGGKTAADFDADGDVDLKDVGKFQDAFSNP